MAILTTTMVDRVESHFLGVPEYQARNFQAAHIYKWIDGVLEYIYDLLHPQPEEFTVNTVVGTEKYEMDSGTGHLSDEIGEIVKVDYDGAELNYHYLYPEEVIPKASTDDNGPPDGWSIGEISGVKYLFLVADSGSGFKAIGADSVVVVRVYAHRIPAPIAGTALETIKLDKDFEETLYCLVLAKVYGDLRLYNDRDAWRAEGEMLLRQKMRNMAARLGRKVTHRRVFRDNELSY
jgi:hypothetical protein